MSEREYIPQQRMRELFDHLERTGYWGTVEVTFQSKPVLVQLHRQALKPKDLEDMLVRENYPQYRAASINKPVR